MGEMCDSRLFGYGIMMRICTRILFIRDGKIVEDLSDGQKEKIVRLLRGEE